MAIVLTEGGEFTAIRNEVLVARVPSETEMVIVELPLVFDAGVMVMVRFDPFPERVILASGTRVLFELAALIVSEVAGVSASETVNGMADVEVLRGTDWLGIEEITGAAFCVAPVKKVALAPVVVPMLFEATAR